MMTKDEIATEWGVHYDRPDKEILSDLDGAEILFAEYETGGYEGDSTGLPPASVYGAKAELDAREAYLEKKSQELIEIECEYLNLSDDEARDRRPRLERAEKLVEKATRDRDESKARYEAALAAQADAEPRDREGDGGATTARGIGPRRACGPSIVRWHTP